ncbi:hypothetical protein SAMN05444000_10472 [Shimia gijangensis]|uniref:Uncharacterized protein n=1 Tax=Shimia gijangensis TaxID=1470563 RepID=A0A1M6FH74_9RHOB|nr:hypothetical protein SAMN05444000_10472 [Shimia gijangensis]
MPSKELGMASLALGAGTQVLLSQNTIRVCFESIAPKLCGVANARNLVTPLQ